ncbi:MAG: glycosyltransferase [Candidatus Omnitrophica bacterium]|nr:glycosyltransferase [Candidatus Omnitrophota bacterium]
MFRFRDSMKILLISPTFLVPWVWYTACALKRLNHQVIPFLSSSPWVDRLTLRQGRQLLSRFPGGVPLVDIFRERWLAKRDQRLLALARQAQPELILILRGETLSASLLRALKASTRAPLITWWLDNPFRFPIEDRLPLIDHFYLFDRSYLPDLKKAGARTVSFLPCACDETVYRPLALSPLQRRRFHSEVAFVAWHAPGRDRMVQALAEFDLKVWGRGWGSPQVRASLNGAWRRVVSPERYVPDRTTARIYNAASMGLNVHDEQARQAGLNARAFELLGCGTFELTDHVPGMEELLTPEREVATYRSPGEAREKVSYYLRHPEEARRMAQEGRRRVLQEHTYLHRMRTLLKPFDA